MCLGQPRAMVGVEQRFTGPRASSGALIVCSPYSRQDMFRVGGGAEDGVSMAAIAVYEVRNGGLRGVRAIVSVKVFWGWGFCVRASAGGREEGGAFHRAYLRRTIRRSGQRAEQPVNVSVA